MTTPAPGWYEDPAGGGGQRYWDGASWTDDVRPVAHQDPPYEVESVPAVGMSDDPPGAGGRHAGRGPLIAGAGVLLVLALAVTAVAVSDAPDSEGVDDRSAASDEPDDAQAEPEVEQVEPRTDDEPEEEAADSQGPEAPGPFAESGTVTILHPLTGHRRLPLSGSVRTSNSFPLQSRHTQGSALVTSRSSGPR